jgi:Thiamine pyrophosphate enzyme, N-terminal TPP binding domain/Thiamine pyrophosphate enzyme, central domain
MLETMREAGVRYLFANLGSDHTAIIEAYAQARRDGRTDAMPEMLLCPHEFVALSAAQGYTQVSGEAQAVLVHVDCGTQNLGGAVHNAARGRVPVLILAGLSPMTAEGELRGSRNEFIHWLQDTSDQPGLVRGYVKYAHEIRTGANAGQLVHRALQIARSEPPGPVYLSAAREVLEAPAPPLLGRRQWWAPVAPAALAPQVADEIATALRGAAAPLVVTSYLGRDAAAVAALVRLCELAAIPVIESVPMRVNFPASHPLHCGYQWNEGTQNRLLAEADVILVAGSDVPWMPAVNRPAPSARIFMLDPDPVKEHMPLWHIPASCYARADLALALGQITARLTQLGGVDEDAAQARARRARADRGDHQLRRGLRAPAAGRAGDADRQRRQLAGLVGRRRGRGEAGRAGPDRGVPGGGRLLPVRGAVERAVDGPPVRRPFAHRRVRQRGLDGAHAVRPLGAPGRGGGGRRVRHRLLPGPGPGGGGCRGGRRVRGDRDRRQQAAGHAAAGARPRQARPLRRGQCEGLAGMRAGTRYGDISEEGPWAG